jgi:hypothetical protein
VIRSTARYPLLRGEPLLVEFALHLLPTRPDLLDRLLHAALRFAGFLRLIGDLILLPACDPRAILFSSSGGFRHIELPLPCAGSWRLE